MFPVQTAEDCLPRGCIQIRVNLLVSKPSFVFVVNSPGFITEIQTPKTGGKETMTVYQKIQESATLRLVIIGILTLLLLIPVAMITSMISERTAYREQAVREVSGLWGGAQHLIGPLLIIPYRIRIKDEKGRITEEVRQSFFLPESVEMVGELNVRRRKRGIFEVPLYSLNWQIGGEFTRPDPAELKIDSGDFLWREATVALFIPDTRGIRSGKLKMTWGGRQLEFLPGTGLSGSSGSGIHIRVGDLRNRPRYEFATMIKLQGSHSIHFAPVGKTSLVHLKSNWPDPSFIGSFLPLKREVNDDGFTAHWQVSHLGANIPRQWTGDGDSLYSNAGRSSFGVNLLVPTDFYRKAERAVKYAVLFIVLTFLAFFLFEIFFRLRLHPVQYLLVGGALCLFYVVFLALAEQLGFFGAYFLATVVIIGMIGGYGLSVLKDRKRAMILSGGLFALYTYLFITLQSQDYALLFGALLLTLVLGGVMYLTRNVDWHNLRMDGGESQGDRGQRGK